MKRKGIILLGGVGMTQRHLDKISNSLYPTITAQGRVRQRPHSILQLVNVRYSFPTRFDELRRSLDFFDGGAIIHTISGSAFFSTRALSEWRDERVKGVILDSVPQLRLESSLMKLVGVPAPLVGPASYVARSLLVSPLFEATLDYTDTYSALIRSPTTYGGAKVMFAHSLEDEVVPHVQFKDFLADVGRTDGWGKSGYTVYEGVGKHAAMARDDAGFKEAVKHFVKSCDGFQHEE